MLVSGGTCAAVWEASGADGEVGDLQDLTTQIGLASHDSIGNNRAEIIKGIHEHPQLGSFFDPDSVVRSIGDYEISLERLLDGRPLASERSSVFSSEVIDDLERLKQVAVFQIGLESLIDSLTEQDRNE